MEVSQTGSSFHWEHPLSLRESFLEVRGVSVIPHCSILLTSSCSQCGQEHQLPKVSEKEGELKLLERENIMILIQLTRNLGSTFSPFKGMLCLDYTRVGGKMKWSLTWHLHRRFRVPLSVFPLSWRRAISAPSSRCQVTVGSGYPRASHRNRDPAPSRTIVSLEVSL